VASRQRAEMSRVAGRTLIQFRRNCEPRWGAVRRTRILRPVAEAYWAMAAVRRRPNHHARAERALKHAPRRRAPPMRRRP